MVTILLDVMMLFILVLAFHIGRIIADLRRPVARALGCILSKLCVVNYLEIRQYCIQLDEEKRAPIHLAREIRRQKVFVIGQYVRQMMCNTQLFQQASLFEAKKIDPRKSALEYDMRETLVLSLVEESGALRWQLWKCQGRLLLRSALRLNVNQNILLDLLGSYKKLEADIIALAGMADDNCYRDMMMERLGLMA